MNLIYLCNANKNIKLYVQYLEGLTEPVGHAAVLM